MVVEDEAHLAQGLRFNLEAENHEVIVCETGEIALSRLLESASTVDILVLDVMLPGIDGFTVASELRKAHQFLPILMLTARHRSEDVLKGFASGADDYLPKPFDLNILLARINSLVRRRAWTQHVTNVAPVSEENQPTSFEFNGRTVDFRALELRTPTQTFQLTLMEMELLRYLIRHNGSPVSRKQILEEVWGLHVETDTRAIDNFIVRLRKYIEDEPGQPQYLQTVRGVGYKFVATPDH